MTKVCTRCGVEKNLSEFYVQKRGRHGVRAECKICFDAKYSPKEQQNRKQRRVRVLKVLGGKCASCGDTVIEHLTLDHIHNNGAEERKRFKNSNSMYLEVERRGIPKDQYQVLCWNCNTTKYIYGKPAMQARNEIADMLSGLDGEGI